MRILALDLGNTKGMAGLVEDGRVRASLRRERSERQASHPLAELYDWCRSQIAEAPVEGIVVASVVPDALPLWRGLWERGASTKRLPLQLVSHETSFPFTIELERLESVGADRWCNVAGARARGHHDALIVDLGTANTYDVLVADSFCGGAIAPGLILSHAAVLSAGARLPDLEFRRPEGVVGRNTQQAILSGSWNQGLGGVESMVARILDRWPGLPILLTGGIASLVAEALRFEARYLPHLTLEGAASLFHRPPS